MTPDCKKKSILLVNPWIHDFAAYDFWMKPLGLLYVGAILRAAGYEVGLLDCLDLTSGPPPIYPSAETTPAAGFREGAFL